MNLRHALAYSTFIGGTGSDAANSIPHRSSGMRTSRLHNYLPTFPPRIPIQAAFAGGGTTCPAQSRVDCGDAFVTELDPTGSTLSFFLPRRQWRGFRVGLVLDPAEIYTFSGEPIRPISRTTTGAFQTTFGGGSTGCTNAGEACGDAFLQDNAAKTAYVYSTYLGGTGDDVAGLGLAIDAAGNIHMAE